MLDQRSDAFAEWLAMGTGHPVHWWFGPEHPAPLGGVGRPGTSDGDSFCPEYVTGDAVASHDPAVVTCRECLEWLHA